MRIPRIRTILLVVNLLMLLVPLAGIAFLRIYDNDALTDIEGFSQLREAHRVICYGKSLPKAECERLEKQITP